MTNDMAGSTALVTGATSGIGTAIATTLAARGAKVLVSGRDRDRGDAVVSEIRGGGGQAEFVYGDLRGAAAAKDLAARSRDLAAGTIDILINNAAIGVVAPTADFPEDGFHTVVATNVEAPFYLVASLAPAMVAQGRGAIVNIASLAGSWLYRECRSMARLRRRCCFSPRVGPLNSVLGACESMLSSGAHPHLGVGGARRLLGCAGGAGPGPPRCQS